MALPGQRPVFGVSSAAALALTAAETLGETRVAILGDARRERVWCVRFETGVGGVVSREGDPVLVRAEELAAAVPDDYRVVTPDWSRIGEVLLAQLADRRVVKEPLFPTAESVARIARLRMSRNLPSEPLRPVYLHPPVSVAPRFV
jgi:tRNA A37 threonylcarbamoyladenosine modification protein TsaB